MLQAFYDAVARATRSALDDPDAAVQNLADNADGVDVEFASAEFANVAPYFLGSDGNFGTLEEAAFDEYLEWADGCRHPRVDARGCPHRGVHALIATHA